MTYSSDNHDMQVAALQNGTVIDHIPCPALFKAVEILGIANADSSVTIGYNLDSKKLGRKGIIKVAEREYDDAVLNRIALIAPTAVVNVIRDYKVVSKHPVRLPDQINGIVRCSNPKCITNNEPMVTRFHVENRTPVQICCHYCGRTVDGSEAQIL